jgi:hypothetical protein
MSSAISIPNVNLTPCCVCVLCVGVLRTCPLKALLHSVCSVGEFEYALAQRGLILASSAGEALRHCAPLTQRMGCGSRGRSGQAVALQCFDRRRHLCGDEHSPARMAGPDSSSLFFWFGGRGAHAARDKGQGWGLHAGNTQAGGPADVVTL